MSYKIEKINGVTKIKNLSNGITVYNFDNATVILQDDEIKIFHRITTGFNWEDFLGTGLNSEDELDEWCKLGLFSNNDRKVLELLERINNTCNSNIEILKNLEFYLQSISE